MVLSADSKGVGTVRYFASAMGLTDIWRAHNPTVRQYIRLLAAHGGMAQLDYIFTQTLHVGRFSAVALKAQEISDHSPAEVMLTGPSRSRDLPPRVDPWYLKDRAFGDRVRDGIDQCFQDKALYLELACVLWEAFEAVLRGQVQALIGGIRKERRLKCEALERDCASLEA
ncbi:hypothetical protein NDU88_006077 [Pleurodeles waltl]|uniref:Uncharacterized protein n=1 Tax=Pleurodeles waltl TaxID=8319 RepID=A0AAV7TW39_PLEWA|nr:hypothetical protein NDU88_006077 [Pleurodeles waltl]